MNQNINTNIIKHLPSWLIHSIFGRNWRYGPYVFDLNDSKRLGKRPHLSTGKFTHNDWRWGTKLPKLSSGSYGNNHMEWKSRKICYKTVGDALMHCMWFCVCMYVCMYVCTSKCMCLEICQSLDVKEGVVSLNTGGWGVTGWRLHLPPCWAWSSEAQYWWS